MSGEFATVPREEQRGRVTGAARLMREAGLDAMLLFNKEDFHYYTGFRKTWDWAWLHGVVVTEDARTVVVCPQIAHRLIEGGSWVDQVRPFGGAPHWGHPSDPVALLVEVIGELGLSRATIGLEMGPVIYPDATIGELDELRRRLPEVTFRNAMDLVWKQRMVKTDWELGVVRKLADITVKGFKAGLECLHEGITEREALAVVWDVFVAEGAHDTPMSGQVMLRGGVHDYDMSVNRPLDRKLTRGRGMYFDGGPGYMGYHSDIQRQVQFGKPSDLQRRLYDLSLEGQVSAEAAIKPGNTVADVHRAAMRVISHVSADLASQGVEYVYSHTFMGHGAGLFVHEPPWITADCDIVLRPGMLFSLEVPALDIPRFRVLGGFPEDLYLVTKDGHENLTGSLSRELRVID